MTRLLGMAALAIAIAGSASAAPCIAASTNCTEWIAFQGGPARSLLYRTYSLESKNPAITRAVVMVHGAGRDADNYFRTAVAAAFLAGALENTVVISPRFASNDGRGCRDLLAANEVSWPCNGDSWRSGGISPGNENLNSFAFADEILRKLARKDAFPNLKAIVVAGHSAGGQFVNRYEMANTVHDTLGVPVTYVVSNPSSYAYLDSMRPNAETEFHAFSDARNCTTFDAWPYGRPPICSARSTFCRWEDLIRRVRRWRRDRPGARAERRSENTSMRISARITRWSLFRCAATMRAACSRRTRRCRWFFRKISKAEALRGLKARPPISISKFGLQGGGF